MEFENNWVYPFPTIMYDPVLKVRVVVSSFRDSTKRDVPFTIYYDPEIDADHITVPVSPETIARWLADPFRQHLAEDATIRDPFISGKEKK